jgi:hypothetical protein
MPSDRRTVWALAALAVVMGIGAWTWFGPGSTPSPAQTQVAPGRAAAGRAAPLPQAEAMTVRMSALEGKRAEPTDSARNPFQFGARATSEQPSDAAPAPVMAPPAPTAPPGPPPLPPIALKFIGIVQKADGLKLAVLTDGRAPLYGKEGDIIDGRYRILSIGTESIDMSYADGRGRQTIRLSGQ